MIQSVIKKVICFMKKLGKLPFKGFMNIHKLMPYIICSFICVISAIKVILDLPSSNLDIYGCIMRFTLYVVIWGLFYYVCNRIAEWVINRFIKVEKKYTAPDIIRYVKQEYNNDALSERTKIEVISLLQEHSGDFLPEEEKEAIRKEKELRKQIECKKQELEKLLKKRIDTILEYTTLLFCGRLDDYESLEESMKQFLVNFDCSKRYYAISKNDDFSKADIRVFCNNVREYFDVPLENMANFQRKVFGNWFPDNKPESFVSNFNKTGSSKLPKVSDKLSLQEIINNIKAKRKYD